MKNRFTILIVDDTETNVDILVELLSDIYEIVVALDGESALGILNDQSIDLILLDIMMPKMDGYEVCKRAKQKPDTHDIPIIFITAKIDENSIEKAYDIGGVDYVTKPFKPKELFARIKTQLHLRELIKELETSRKTLKRLSELDPMTNLCNRRYFTHVSKNVLALARRDRSDLSLIMLDIDKFKRINDTYGHKMGDDVLVAFAGILLKMIRKSDYACRFGGEEFIVMLPETPLDGAIEIAEKIRKSIEALSLKTENHQNVMITVSLGVTCVDLLNDPHIESAIQRADEALYRAKKEGRNQVVALLADGESRDAAVTPE